MKSQVKNRIIAPQAAIDTICDHCGGIFDLNYGVVNLSSKILCPECISADAVENDEAHKHRRPKTILNPLHIRRVVPRHSIIS